MLIHLFIFQCWDKKRSISNQIHCFVLRFNEYYEKRFWVHISPMKSKLTEIQSEMNNIPQMSVTNKTIKTRLKFL